MQTAFCESFVCSHSQISQNPLQMLVCEPDGCDARSSGSVGGDESEAEREDGRVDDETQVWKS